MSEEIKKSFDSDVQLPSDNEDELPDNADTNSKSEEIDDDNSDGFSKESSMKFSDHESHETLALTEAHRSGLEKKNAELNVEIKAENERNMKLNRQLIEFLTKQGISCLESDIEDQIAVDEYHTMLERLYGINEKYQQIKQIMQQRSADATATKQERLDTLGRLQKEFTEMVTSAMSDSRHGTCPPEKFVAKLLRRFNKAYENTSLVRLEFLKAQNALVELIEKEKALSNIGEGWKTLDYDNLTTEVQTVSSTIDLKQEQMEKLWSRYRKEIKALKSMRAELNGLQQSISDKTEIYDLLRDQEVAMLSVLQDLDEDKKNLKEKFTDLSHRAGILGRAPLMKHYDSVSHEITRLSNELSEAEALNAQLTGQNIKLKCKIKETKGSKTTLRPESVKSRGAAQLSPQNSELSLADCLQICKIDI